MVIGSSQVLAAKFYEVRLVGRDETSGKGPRGKAPKAFVRRRSGNSPLPRAMRAWKKRFVIARLKAQHSNIGRSHFPLRRGLAQSKMIQESAARFLLFAAGFVVTVARVVVAALSTKSVRPHQIKVVETDAGVCLAFLPILGFSVRAGAAVRGLPASGRPAASRSCSRASRRFLPPRSRGRLFFA